MNLKICVVTHAIPNTIGIAIPAVVMLTVKQSVLVLNGLLQTHSSITVCTINILTIVFLHDVLPQNLILEPTRTPPKHHLRSVSTKGGRRRALLPFSSFHMLLGFVHGQVIQRINII